MSADGTAAFTGLGSSRLVDTDGDGHPDEFDVDVDVSVPMSDTYHLAVDVHVPGGAKLLSAPGERPSLQETARSL